MKKWWNELSTFWKVALGIGVLLIAIFIFDRITGAVSNYESWANNKVYNERMEKDKQYEEKLNILRKEKAELDRRAVEVKAKEAVFAEREKSLNVKESTELQKLEVALAAQDAEEARTAQPVDALTRCERTKQKMLDLKIASAKEISCEEFKQ